MDYKEDELHDEYASENGENDVDDDGSCLGGYFKFFFYVVVIIALIYWNPSPADHKAKIKEQLKEVVQSKVATSMVKGRKIDYFSAGILSMAIIEKHEYHSIYVCSWTTMRIDGKQKVLSVGALGFTAALF